MYWNSDHYNSLGDLIGFKGHLNETTPFSVKEHEVLWKTDRHYVDFDIGNTYNESCNYPQFWNETGYPVDSSISDQLVGCYDSDFDQNGDREAFGVFPDWQRQLSKFASVQDRLREWHPSVQERLIRHNCMIIRALDIDGFRYDKATQATVDALGDISNAYRKCARELGKDNFFISGEVTGGNTFGSIYLGRGRRPDQYLESPEQGMALTNESSHQHFIREEGKEAFDASAFHYSVYRALTRFLGMDGNLAAGYDTPVDLTDTWNLLVMSNDMVNPNTGKFDPRHMFGATNQDLFRWPALQNGIQRQLLAQFMTTLHLPGIPLLLWGEEQAFYILDSTAKNYIFGRQAMSPATAWKTHGCFAMDSAQYYQWPLEAALDGCHDDTVTYDHRDPSHPVRNILKHMYQMRKDFPVLNDGWWVQKLSNKTRNVYMPGSDGTPTETGLWSILRDKYGEVQDLGSEADNQPVWLVYQNDNDTVEYQFDCSDNETALISPFPAGTWVKNLFYPHDEHKLQAGPKELGLNGSTETNGCLDSLTLEAYEFRAYVPSRQFVPPRPMVTKFEPGHDVPILSTVSPDLDEDIDVKIYFSAKMDCNSVTRSISFNSSTEAGTTPSVNTNSVKCNPVTGDNTPLPGQIPSTWVWSATLTRVYNGVHRLTIKNATSSAGDPTDAVDHFLMRVGQRDNPMLFPSANYSTNLLHQLDNGTLVVRHHAAGADKYRYSTNWGTTFSKWLPYTGGDDFIKELEWTGTKQQEWKGKHVRVEYWNRWTGSSDYVQEGDIGWDKNYPRRFPHLFFNGPFNQYGYDGGLRNMVEQDENGLWRYRFVAEWPAVGQFNVWGMNPDSKPDKSFIYGDADGDAVLDRLPPSSLSATLVNISEHPPPGYLAWDFYLNDASMKFELQPVGSQKAQMAMFFLFWLVPLVTAAVCVYVFMKSFYQVKINEVGVSEKKSFFSLPFWQKVKGRDLEGGGGMNPIARLANKSGFLQSTSAFGAGKNKRRTILIATMEYDIEDWDIKIKIGGLGVMAQLMGKHLGHQDLIWVVPCVGDVDYPEDRPAESMIVTIFGNPYEVQVQYHVLNNITYVLLDAPVFRQQTKSEPYPARMDDLDSAIYYSAWNQCIAQAIKRFPIDLYHINDYHGSVAPLYLLPQTVPVCLSLHNAEFQGLWPMRTQKEKGEVCSVFNLNVDIASRYVQFGEVLNLLHAGASYLRIHQQGFGAVGVSKKYGKRSYARYPIFWGLKKVGNLPNPDPSDTGEWNKELASQSEVYVDSDYESNRGEFKRQAQEWAGLEQRPDADLLVFVGRWSMQKGVDLIADVMPAVLEAHPNVQLICIGPVIDLHGKFAALKLDHMMRLYPGRVFSKPEFTTLPPFVFSGAEFSLIPSRDEPFGLVAVEFGRKGALGIGARVGGLGQMPGWWYNVESTTTAHLLQQFKLAIASALNSKSDVRALMRARSAKQRFPVAQWVEDLEILQSTAVRIHSKGLVKAHGQPYIPSGLNSSSGFLESPIASSGSLPPMGVHTPPVAHSREGSQPNVNRFSNVGPQQRNTIVYSRDPSPDSNDKRRTGLIRSLSLGVRSGPGHLEHRGRRKLRKSRIPTFEENPTPGPTDAEESDDEYIPSYYGDDEYTLTAEQAEESRRIEAARQQGSVYGGPMLTLHSNPPYSSQGSLPMSRPLNSSSTLGAPLSTDDILLPPGRPYAQPANRMSTSSVLSVDTVVGDKRDFKLQKVEPFFTDSTGEYYRAFEARLQGLNGSNSESHLCIEEFLEKSEKKWFDKFRDARLGLSNNTSQFFKGKRFSTSVDSLSNDESDSRDSAIYVTKEGDEFLLGKDYVPPSGIKKWMQVRIGDWPVYSLFLGLGQIIAANSYQITLLTGEVGQTPEKLYGIATVYLITSIIWWFIFRFFKSVVCLSLPWFFYGLAFTLIGVAHWESNEFNRGWIQNVASGAYAAASSSGSLFFALNFGDESGAPVREWVFRACMIQGTQQAYIIGLWYWGSTITAATSNGITDPQGYVTNTWKMTYVIVPLYSSHGGFANMILNSAICLPIAVFLWVIGLLIFFGLPNYYRQTPGKVPSFYKSVLRRKIIMWNFVVVIIQNWFLSAPYGRNWSCEYSFHQRIA